MQQNQNLCKNASCLNFLCLSVKRSFFRCESVVGCSGTGELAKSCLRGTNQMLSRLRSSSSCESEGMSWIRKAKEDIHLECLPFWSCLKVFHKQTLRRGKLWCNVCLAEPEPRERRSEKCIQQCSSALNIGLQHITCTCEQSCLVQWRNA